MGMTEQNLFIIVLSCITAGIGFTVIQLTENHGMGILAMVVLILILTIVSFISKTYFY